MGRPPPPSSSSPSSSSSSSSITPTSLLLHVPPWVIHLLPLAELHDNVSCRWYAVVHCCLATGVTGSLSVPFPLPHLVSSTCKLGCSGLKFCTNYNNRPTELFRLCTTTSDNMARNMFYAWASTSMILHPLVSFQVEPVTTCHPEMWKVITSACVHVLYVCVHVCCGWMCDCVCVCRCCSVVYDVCAGVVCVCA